MAYFPFFVDIEGKKCLIVGGGGVAYRKALVLKDYGPVITAAAPQMSPEMEALSREMGGRLHLKYREFMESDLEDVDFVVAGTSDESINRRISALCREKGIPVNVVDMQEECSFIFPALIKEKEIVVGISTGGSSPTIAQYLKASFKKVIPKGFGELSRQLKAYRETVKDQVDSPSLRKDIFQAMVEEGIRRGGTLTEEEAKVLIARKLAEEAGKRTDRKEAGKSS